MIMRLFGYNLRKEWEVTLNNDVMIRCCKVTGRNEYRDNQRQCWVPFSNWKELDASRQTSVLLSNPF